MPQRRASAGRETTSSGLSAGSTMPACALREIARAGRALAAGHRNGAVAEFVAHRRLFLHAPLLDRRQPIVAHAGARERRDLTRELDRCRQRFACRYEAIREADVERLLRAHFATGEDQVHRATVADESRQTNRAE